MPAESRPGYFVARTPIIVYNAAAQPHGYEGFKLEEKAGERIMHHEAELQIKQKMKVARAVYRETHSKRFGESRSHSEHHRETCT